jgi:peptidoglycan-N-acetylglucosamine deacetylase
MPMKSRRRAATFVCTFLVVVAALLPASVRRAYAADPFPTPSPTPKLERTLFLTFDDGPFVPGTQQVLDALNEFQVHATFFIIGRQIPGNEELIKRIYEAGHGLANHGYNHASLLGVGWDFFDAEVMDAHDLLGAMDSMCLRPPYGAYDDTTVEWAKSLGYELVRWTVDPQDWRQPGASAIAEHVIAHAQSNAIILMHDGGGERTQTAEALRILIPRLKADGWNFKALCREVPFAVANGTPDPMQYSEGDSSPVVTPAPEYGPYAGPQAAEVGAASIPYSTRTPTPAVAAPVPPVKSAATPTVTPTPTPALTPASSAALARTPTATGTPVTKSGAVASPAEGAVYGAIESPEVGAIARGVVEVSGFADHPEFESWQLDLINASGGTIQLYASDQPVDVAGTLWMWDTRQQPNGVYMLRLRVSHAGNRYEEYFKHVVVQN